MEVKQTVVEWLVEQVHDNNYQNAFGQTYISLVIIEEAKKIEQLQKETEYLRGFQDGIKYYKEEYKNKKN